MKTNLTPLSEIVDKVWGPIGTPERDAMEAQLKEDIQAWHLSQEAKKGTRNGYRRCDVILDEVKPFRI